MCSCNAIIMVGTCKPPYIVPIQIPLSSSVSAGTLVELPVTMTPSLRKYSAAWAVSAILTSAVTE